MSEVVYISPALFERALKIKYVSGEVDGLSRMFDIIRDGLVFDACMFYNEKLKDFYNGFIGIDDGLSSWSAQFNNFKLKGMNTRITGIVDTLRKLPY